MHAIDPRAVCIHTNTPHLENDKHHVHSSRQVGVKATDMKFATTEDRPHTRNFFTFFACSTSAGSEPPVKKLIFHL